VLADFGKAKRRLLPGASLIGFAPVRAGADSKPSIFLREKSHIQILRYDSITILEQGNA
jgi:hypothetical protein